MAHRLGHWGMRSEGSPAARNGHPRALARQAELVSFMLRSSVQGKGPCAASSGQVPQAAPAAGVHGSTQGVPCKAGGQGEIEEEDEGGALLAEHESGLAARVGLEAGKGQETVVENQEYVMCEGGKCFTAVVCSRRATQSNREQHRATVNVSNSSQGSLHDAIIAARTLFDLLLCDEL
ncbi:hypothetical protein DUNSADRAFT_7272 [Dunaliella salina]|uniref:Encoded protein n=1 Tax=Dunaliella salina TaxID=3046 RepID=A0ABQ7FTF1_DUNSA|nr:hypothetical protein DUNSADRAFT_7272 [Dunaliella salina]|eukprot:KAF5825733.1 hypothetical protein DUNSADRAFT_7272 [Dunaliella salina]